TQNGPAMLTLTGANTYSGGTNLNGGILAVNSDANLGTGALSFNGGTLEALAAGGGIPSSKTVMLNARGGTFLAGSGTSSGLNGNISGVGPAYQKWPRDADPGGREHLQRRYKPGIRNTPGGLIDSIECQFSVRRNFIAGSAWVQQHDWFAIRNWGGHQRRWKS